MAKPITWRSINAPAFNSSALATAVNAFSNAGQGFNVFSDQMNDRVAREDERLTNEAIAARLRGEAIPFNRRVDQESLYDIDSQERALQDDLLTSSVGRGLTVAQTRNQNLDAINQEFVNSKQEEVHNLDVSLTKAQQAQAESARKRSDFGLTVDESNFKESQALSKGTDALNLFEARLSQAKEDEYLSEEVVPGTEPTTEQRRAARIRANAFVTGPDGQDALTEYMLNNNIDPDAFNNANVGRRAALAEATAADVAGANAKRAADRADADYQSEQDLAVGDFSTTVLRNGSMRGGTKEELTKEKMSNFEEVLSALQNGTDGVQGVNINRYLNDPNSDDAKLIKFAAKKIPTRSMFVSALQTYFDPDGELDSDKLRSALSTIGRDAISFMQQVNADRKAKGLPEISIPEQSASGEASRSGSRNSGITTEQIKEKLKTALPNTTIDLVIHPSKEGDPSELGKVNNLVNTLESARSNPQSLASVFGVSELSSTDQKAALKSLEQELIDSLIKLSSPRPTTPEFISR